MNPITPLAEAITTLADLALELGDEEGGTLLLALAALLLVRESQSEAYEAAKSALIGQSLRAIHREDGTDIDAALNELKGNS